jgi:hypothetical protein
MTAWGFFDRIGLQLILGLSLLLGMLVLVLPFVNHEQSARRAWYGLSAVMLILLAVAIGWELLG